MIAFKKFVSAQTRKLVPSPDPSPEGSLPVMVRVLSVTRTGWSFDCPLKGKRTMLFDDMTKDQMARVQPNISI
jgi:hypothetical protein